MEPKSIPRTETPLKQELKPSLIPRKDATAKQEAKPPSRKETSIKKEPLEKNGEKTGLKPAPFPKMTGVAGGSTTKKEIDEEMKKEQEAYYKEQNEIKRQKEKEAYKEKYGDTPSPYRPKKIDDTKRLERNKLIRELRSNRRFIERQNPLAEQARRSMEEAMKAQVQVIFL